MNDSISEKERNGCDLDATDQMTAKVTTNVTFPSTTKKVKSGRMKMPGYGVIASSNPFLLDSYQYLIDIDSDFALTGTIIGIPWKQACYWNIQWENNFVTTKIRTRVLDHM